MRYQIAGTDPAQKFPAGTVVQIVDPVTDLDKFLVENMEGQVCVIGIHHETGEWVKQITNRSNLLSLN